MVGHGVSRILLDFPYWCVVSLSRFRPALDRIEICSWVCICRELSGYQASGSILAVVQAAIILIQATTTVNCGSKLGMYLRFSWEAPHKMWKKQRGTSP